MLVKEIYIELAPPEIPLLSSAFPKCLPEDISLRIRVNDGGYPYEVDRKALEQLLQGLRLFDRDICQLELNRLSNKNFSEYYVNVSLSNCTEVFILDLPRNTPSRISI